MTGSNEANYYRRRAAVEEAAAVRSTSDAARMIHRELSRLHLERAALCEPLHTSVVRQPRRAANDHTATL